MYVCRSLRPKDGHASHDVLKDTSRYSTMISSFFRLLLFLCAFPLLGFFSSRKPRSNGLHPY